MPPARSLNSPCSLSLLLFFFLFLLFCTWTRASSVSPDVSIAPQWLRLSRCSLGTLASLSCLSLSLYFLTSSPPRGKEDLTSLYFSLTPSPASIQSLPPFHPAIYFATAAQLPLAKPLSPSLNFCGAPRGAAAPPPFLPRARQPARRRIRRWQTCTGDELKRAAPP